MKSSDARGAAYRLRGVAKYLAQESEFLSSRASERGIQRTPAQTMRAAHLLDEVILALDKHAAKAAVEETQREREQQARQERLADLMNQPNQPQPWAQGGTQ